MSNNQDAGWDPLRYALDCLTYGYASLPSYLPSSWASFFPMGEVIPIGNRRFRIIKKLGEGGYAIVYLVQELSTARHPQSGPPLFAVKKVYAHSGEHLAAVRCEMRIQGLLRHPNLLPLLDSSSADTRCCPETGAVHACYFLFPLYEDGTLAEHLEALRGHRARLRTADVLSIFGQMCAGLAHMHALGYAHRDVKPLNVLLQCPRGHSDTQQQQVNGQPRAADVHAPGRAAPPPFFLGGSGASGAAAAASAVDVEHGQGRRQALLSQQQQRQAGEGQLTTAALNDGGSVAGAGSPSGNACEGDSGYRAVLMDFGSAAARVVQVATRQEALRVQEDAEAHCSAPYRAPELLDVPSPSSLDYAACDVWAAGCSLFHLMYGEPPFQRAMEQAGGSLALAVLNRSIAWPKDAREAYPQPLHQLVDKCMALAPAERPTMQQLLEAVEGLQRQRLPDPPAAALC